jgi:3-hydroxybutyryl-CoA dehydrogenase
MEGKLERIAVIGTGTLGSQIAMIAAHAGYRVVVFDPREGALTGTLEKLKASLVPRGDNVFIPWDRWEACRQSIVQVTDLGEAVKGADLIIEAVPENLEMKRRVWKEMARHASPRAILGTNSSSIPVSRLEDCSGGAERCLNIHFYQPLMGMNIVDVMGGTRTVPEVLERGISWVRSLRCIPLTVNKEILGFCFNRVWRAIKRETLYMWANGFVDFRDVDRAWMVFTGMKMGPFGLMDAVGLDVVHDIEMVYFEDSGDPRDRPPDALRSMLDRGCLGVKTGEGFYRYPDPEYSRPDFLGPTG